MTLTQDKNYLLQQNHSDVSISRRRFLTLGSIAALTGIFPRKAFGSPAACRSRKDPWPFITPTPENN